jgi:hypothetical protein
VTAVASISNPATMAGCPPLLQGWCQRAWNRM